MKNTLSTVMSVARQSFSNAASLDAARKSLEGRIQALAHAHTQLADANWSGVSLRNLLLDELTPYRSETGENLRLDGADVRLNSKGR